LGLPAKPGSKTATVVFQGRQNTSCVWGQFTDVTVMATGKVRALKNWEVPSPKVK